MDNAAAVRSANLLGSLWMIAAMGIFAIEDSLLKTSAAILPIGQVLIMFGMGGAAVFALLARSQGQRLFTPDAVSRPMRIRMFFEVTGRLFYVIAIALTPLSAATVIVQATPLVVVAGAALIFGEKVGWRRWTAILIGLAGVVIIIQPGRDSFSALSILTVIGMLGFAGRDLASRAAPASLGTNVLGFYGFLAVIVAGAIHFAVYGGAVWPNATTTAGLAMAVAAGVGAYTCLMRAMRTGEVSAVTPFRYTRLLFGIGLGMAVFGERLTGPMVLGSSLIVLSGMFIMWRGRVVPE